MGGRVPKPVCFPAGQGRVPSPGSARTVPTPTYIAPTPRWTPGPHLPGSGSECLPPGKGSQPAPLQLIPRTQGQELWGCLLSWRGSEMPGHGQFQGKPVEASSEAQARIPGGGARQQPFPTDSC